ncbi:MAG: SHOCT domain-containing protein, partial [Clostridia bacterium]|nr:SHOCT domain-containing protein [Clostridia bacterium]
MEDRFIFKPEYLAKTEWFGDENFEVLYSQVTKFEIVKRQVSTTEALLGSGDTKDLEQLNNIEITYLDTEGNEQVLRVEMLTGVTVYGQATKCRELLDLLREKKILPLLNKKNVSENTAISSADEIKKYKDLLDSGIITQEEFDAK